MIDGHEVKFSKLQSGGGGEKEEDTLRGNRNAYYIHASERDWAREKLGVSLYIIDSVDKDYFELDSYKQRHEEEFDTEVLISLNGNYNNGLDAMELESVEILEPLEEVDFGYLEPSPEFYGAEG